MTVDPRQVANVDQDMINIHKIIKRTGTPNRKGHMIFLVRWSDDDETWER